MRKKDPEDYEIEDFLMNDSFVNYYFHLNIEHEIFWEEWLSQHPAKASLAKEAGEMLEMLSLSPRENEDQQELERIKRAIDKEQLAAKNQPTPLPWNKVSGNFRKRRFSRYFAAAAVFIVLVSGYLFLRYLQSPSIHLTERQNNGLSPVVFTLNDGTIITLAPNSSLHYPSNLKTKTREVYLNGEAQFHVSRDVNHPFKVHADNLVATVLGTIFNIKRQQGDTIMLVELLEGSLKVELGNTSGSSVQPIMLEPNERIVYNQYSQKLYKESWQRSPVPTSPTNHLVFRQNNFQEIAKQLKSVFGITIINQSAKKNWRFTGEFNNTTANDIIENICLIKGLSSQATGDTIFIK